MVDWFCLGYIERFQFIAFLTSKLTAAWIQLTLKILVIWHVWCWEIKRNQVCCRNDEKIFLLLATKAALIYENSYSIFYSTLSYKSTVSSPYSSSNTHLLAPLDNVIQQRYVYHSNSFIQFLRSIGLALHSFPVKKLNQWWLPTLFDDMSVYCSCDLSFLDIIQHCPDLCLDVWRSSWWKTNLLTLKMDFSEIPQGTLN